eukprot:jgi/Mesen1/6806/ME000035S06190
MEYNASPFGREPMRRSRSSNVIDLVPKERSEADKIGGLLSPSEQGGSFRKSRKNVTALCIVGLMTLTLFSVTFGMLIHPQQKANLPAYPGMLQGAQHALDLSEEIKLADKELTDAFIQPAPRLTSEGGTNYYGCAEPTSSYGPAVERDQSTGYLVIEASGGLNQQRTGITDSVVVARILNATLIVPQLDHSSYWRDRSNFGDIFDVKYFIKQLANDVPIIEKLPSHLEDDDIPAKLIPRKSSPSVFLQKVLPLLQTRKVVKLTKFDFRLSNHLEEVDLQKLRCRVNYGALRFTSTLRTLGEHLINKIRSLKGTYIAVHLRFEKDMLAFSGCYFGGGSQERQELALIRKRWKTLRARSPQKERRKGRCPLTPTEVGLLLRALGHGNDTILYIASGEVYGGQATMAPLRAMFPRICTKESLLPRAELQRLAGHQSRLAALDYMVCEESDVFVANNHGNMARLLQGQRRFNGHRPTITPNPRKIAALMSTRNSMLPEVFAEKVRLAQQGFMGEPHFSRSGRGEFHRNPQACICETESSKRARLEGGKADNEKSPKSHGKRAGDAERPQKKSHSSSAHSLPKESAFESEAVEGDGFVAGQQIVDERGELADRPGVSESGQFVNYRPELRLGEDDDILELGDGVGDEATNDEGGVEGGSGNSDLPDSDESEGAGADGDHEQSLLMSNKDM